MGRCPAGRDTVRTGRACPACRRDVVVQIASEADRSLSLEVVAAAVDAAAPSGQALARLAAALADGPGALAAGAPPVAGRLAAELIARGCTTLAPPACTRCGRTGRPLFRGAGGGVCQSCRAWQLAVSCSGCGKVKPVAVHTETSQPLCEVCRRRSGRASRQCGTCGKTAPVAVRGRDGQPDVCANCYQLPQAVCSVCGRRRQCNFAATSHPVCPSCAPKATAACAHCCQVRPPAARWPEGPVCDPCYTAALRRRGQCASCGQQRRLVAPPGPAAATCADCAGLPAMCVCCRCGIEDKLYEKGLCARCSLRRRATMLLSDGTGDVPGQMQAVLEAICATRNPRTALNWLRKGAGAAILADLAAARTAATHETLDDHPRPRAAGYLRQVLVAGGVLPCRDEELARAEKWLTGLLAEITDHEQRRLVRSFATWHVMRRLRRSSAAQRGQRTYTARARNSISAAARLQAWLAERGTSLRDCRQADIDDWVTTTGPGAADAGDFLAWAARHGHCAQMEFPRPARNPGTAIADASRWDLVAGLLHDDAIDLTDRVAGCMVLLFGQNMTRVAALETRHVSSSDDGVRIQLGRHAIPVPGTLGTLMLNLIANGRPYTGTGSPATSKWLFPGLLPGQPITAARLADRLRALGIPVQASRRAALTGLAAQLPAAVLADALGLSPGTAVRWAHDAGTDWTRYAADLARTGNHKQGE
jgi:hypothetical protein